MLKPLTKTAERAFSSWSEVTLATVCMAPQPQPELRPSYLAGAIVAVVCTLLGLCFLIFGVGEPLTHLSYDIPFAFRSTIKPSEVLLLYLDEESSHWLKQDRFDRWDRRLHTRALRQLKTLGAKAVVFDVLFQDNVDPVVDSDFVAAVQEHGNVFVAGVVGPEMFNEQVVGTKPIRPFPELAAAARGWGMVEVVSSSDSVIREQYTGALAVPSLNWLVATQLMGGVLPNEPTARRWMNYYGPPGTIPWASYYHAISNTLSPSLVSNRVVYVGARFSISWTGGRGTDDLGTPYSRWERGHRKSPGVEVNATAFLNVLRGESLRRPSPWLEVLWIALMGMLLGFGLMWLKPIHATLTGVAFAALLAVGSCELVWHHQVWMPWMIPIAVQLPAALTCCLVVRSHLRGELQLPARAPRVDPAATPHGQVPLPTLDLHEQFKRLQQAQTPGPLGAGASANHPSSPQPVIPDHELLKCVGKGAYGEVWLARTILGGYRAVKLVYRRSFSEDQPYEREFQGIRHFEPISRTHGGLVPILHVGRDDAAGYYYYLMEPADDVERGESIDPESYTPRTLGREISRRGALPLEECLELAHSLALALGFLHDQGLLHRDIKPSNIIFIKGVPKLADIGLVTPIDESISFVGTQGYFPPEGPGTPSADLFSLGKVLYQCLTGFSCARFPELPTRISDGRHRSFGRFNDLILKACHPESKKRYQAAGEFCAELARLRSPASRGWFRRD